jgi:hypothetical protein
VDADDYSNTGVYPGTGGERTNPGMSTRDADIMKSNNKTQSKTTRKKPSEGRKKSKVDIPIGMYI